MKKYEELKLSDDFMFGKVMEDPILCKGFLERLLQRKIGELEVPQSQKEHRYSMDGKPIRMDIYTRDEKEIYDAEMQNLNHKKPEDYDLPKRSRFYQSVIDTDYLKKNQIYRALPDTNVVFVCTFDPLELGLPIYTFRNRCDEKSEIELGDGRVISFFNCIYEGDDISKDLQILYRYITTGEEGDELTEKLERKVEEVRQNEKWRAEYMKELVIFQELREEGRAEERAKVEAAEARAEKAEYKVNALEAEVQELKRIIGKMCCEQ